MPVKMTKSEARKLAKKTIEYSKKHGMPLKRKKGSNKSSNDT